MATTEKIFIAVDVETGDSVTSLEQLRANLKGVEAEIKSVERARKRGTITAKEANKQRKAAAAVAKSIKKLKGKQEIPGIPKTFRSAGKAAAEFLSEEVLYASQLPSCQRTGLLTVCKKQTDQNHSVFQYVGEKPQLCSVLSDDG